MTSRTKILMMVFVGAAVSLGTLVAQAQKKPAIAYPEYPNDPRGWRHVKTMVIFSKDNKLYDRFGGLHNVYVNDIGWPALEPGKLARGLARVMEADITFATANPVTPRWDRANSAH